MCHCCHRHLGAVLYANSTLTAETCSTCCITLDAAAPGFLLHNTCTRAANQRWVIEQVPGQSPWVRIRTTAAYGSPAKYWTVGGEGRLSDTSWFAVHRICATGTVVALVMSAWEDTGMQASQDGCCCCCCC